MRKVGCAGILVADTICGPLDALPHQGQLLSIDALPTRVGGCAANVAIGLRKQQVEADVVGCLGRDGNAQIITDSLSYAGIGCDRLVYSDTNPTSQTIILLVRGEDRRYIHVFGANKDFSVKHIDREWVSSLSVLYIGGLFVLPGINMRDLLDLLKFCRSKGIITVVDVVIPHQMKGLSSLNTLLPYIDYFVPNNDEAALLTGKSDLFDQLWVFQNHGANTVIITCGEHGSIAATGQDVWRTEAFGVATIDPSGGGDAFTAGIITGIVHGWEMPQMLTLGSILGASATTALGTTDGVYTKAEADALVNAHSLHITHEKLG